MQWAGPMEATLELCLHACIVSRLTLLLFTLRNLGSTRNLFYSTLSAIKLKCIQNVEKNSLPPFKTLLLLRI